MAIKCLKCHSDNPDTLKFCGECGTQLTPSESAPDVTKTLETPAQELVRGTVFASRYEIIEKLGKGGMGTVYKALDKQLSEEVALKLIKPEIADDKKTIERFKNELKLARKIGHRNVGRMYELMEEEGKPFITMEYVEGEDLKSYERKEGRLSIDEAIGIAKQVCEGLAEAHELGVIHRDLKPQNIMIDDKGRAKIMDFGIARSVEAPGVTASGMIIGTPDYLSPEQAEGQEADHRSDIYSLGVILYEMVTGELPFKGETAFSVALKHKTQLPQDPKKLNPSISDDLSRLILICMEKDRERRYQTAEALLSDLQNIEDGLPLGTKIKPRRATFIQTLVRKRLFIHAVVAAALIVAALVIWTVLSREQAITAPKIENSIAVISFKNQTGDKTFDYLQDAIPNLIITNLEQTGEVYVATWERMYDILDQMGEGDVELIDRNLGFEVCRREGIGSIALGSYIKAGETFALDVKVLDAESKKLLKSASSKGIGIDSILATQIDELSREIYAGIGLAASEKALAKLKVQDVTTNSMGAYEYYLKGRDAYEKFNFDEAIQNLHKALEIDPDFALAYLKLGEVHISSTNVTEANDAILKAMTYKDKVTEKERLYIEVLAIGRYLGKEQEQEKQIRILQKIAEKYPKEKQVYYYMGRYYQNRNEWNEAIEQFKKGLKLDPRYAQCLIRLGASYAMIDEYEKALEAHKKYQEMRPGEAKPFVVIGEDYFLLGNVDEAIRSFKKAEEIEPGYCSLDLCGMYALKEDYKEAMRWIEESLRNAKSPDAKGRAYTEKAFYLFWLGKFEESLTALDKADELLKAAKNEAAVDSNMYHRYLFYFFTGELELARKCNDQWLDSGIKYYLKYYSGVPDYMKRVRLDHAQMLGMIDMKEGRTDTARRWLAEAKPLIGSEPLWGEFYLFFYNQALAEVLVAGGQYDEAISILENAPAMRSPDSYGTLYFTYNFGQGFLQDTLARAYEGKGDIDKAIEAYVRLMTIDPKRKERFLIHPLYHYRVGKLYEQKGQKRKAVTEYEKFLDLWKDADPRFPEVEDAKKRLADLQ